MTTTLTTAGLRPPRLDAEHRGGHWIDDWRPEDRGLLGHDRRKRSPGAT